MKVVVVTLTFNEEVILPFFLRHYEQFADQIVVFDSGSIDGTLDILKSHPLVEIRHREATGGKIDDLENCRLKNTAWQNTGADWVMVVDADEFLFHRQMKNFLSACDQRKENVVPSDCWQMVGDRIPLGGLLTSHIITGARDAMTAAYYDKVLVFKPETEMVYSPGCHAFAGKNIRPAQERLPMLHYKWLSLDYISHKAAALVMSERNYQHGLGISPTGQPANHIWVDWYKSLHSVRRPLSFLVNEN